MDCNKKYIFHLGKGCLLIIGMDSKNHEKNEKFSNTVLNILREKMIFFGEENLKELSNKRNYYMYSTQFETKEDIIKELQRIEKSIEDYVDYKYD